MECLPLGQRYMRPLFSFRLQTLLALSALFFGAALGQGSADVSCPAADPFGGQDCSVCSSRTECIRSTRKFSMTCFKGAVFLEGAQTKSYRCNFTAPAEFSDRTAPGAFVRCFTNSTRSPGGGPEALGPSCIFGLVASGDTVICTALRCTFEPKSSTADCEEAECTCDSGSCTDGYVSSLVSQMKGRLQWDCKQEGDVPTDAAGPAACTLILAGLPGGSAQAICNVGDCISEDKAISAEGVADDKAKLLGFRASFDNGEEKLPDWNADDENPCQWSGVTCNTEGRVMDLTLDHMGLKGVMPQPSGWPLPSMLQILFMNNNNVSGSLPSNWSLPDPLFRFPFDSNQITGTMPSLRLSRSSLDYFSLSTNQITGTIPGDIQLPPKLSSFSLALNLLSGSVPWDRLPRTLRFLELHQNQFTGTIPQSLALPPNLELLLLHTNQLGGSIPESWVLPASLSRFELQRNRLNGSIPKGWVVPPNVFTFKLDFNRLTGSLHPEWLRRLPTNLDFLSLWANQLTGTFPRDLRLPKLRFLYLSDNKFNGSIPEDWVKQLPPNLLELALDRNLLTGPVLPAQLPPNLRNFSASYNQLTGSLEEGFLREHLPATIDKLYISGAQLSGTLPANLTFLPQLRKLGLQDCNLSGSIPREWPSTLPKTIEWLALDGNFLTGTLPAYSVVNQTSISVKPGNSGLCGKVPASPQYINNNTGEPIDTLPKCGTASEAGAGVDGVTESDGSSSTAVILGSVLGACGLLGVAASLFVWRRRNAHAQRQQGGVLPQGDVQQPPSPALLPSWLRRITTMGIRDVDTRPGTGSDEELRSASQGSTRTTHSKAPAAAVSHSEQSERLLASDPLLACIVSKLPSSKTSSRGVTTSSSGSAGSSRALLGGSGGGGGGRSGGDTKRWGSSKQSGASSHSSRQLVDVAIWTLEFRELELLKQIGSGSFARVYLGRWQGTSVAVKLLLGEAMKMGNISQAATAVLSLSDHVLNDLKREASLTAALRHPNVLGFMGLCTAPPCIVSEWCPRGSLYDTLQAARRNPELGHQLSWGVRLTMAIGAALGMHYLHSFKPPVLHRDLKSNNLLVADDWSIKVADFNLSKVLHTGEGGVGSSAPSDFGNPRWLAPEVLGGCPHSFASDVFSFGVVLYELLTWQIPWANCSFWQVRNNVGEGLRPPIPPLEELPAEEKWFPGLDSYTELMQRCWAQEPADRPSFAAVLEALKRLNLNFDRGQAQQS